MLTFYLIRHGQKEDIPFDPALTKLGIKQAEVTAEYLKNISFTAIIASPKLRTQQTAKIVSKKLGLPIFTNSRIEERMEWEKGKTLEEFIKEWIKTDLNRDYQPEKGESSINKGKIMREVIEDLAEKYQEGNILIVTHGGSIGDLLRNLFTEEALTHKAEPTSGAKFIEIVECSITIIQKERNKYKLLKINDISHLSIPLI